MFAPSCLYRGTWSIRLMASQHQFSNTRNRAATLLQSIVGFADLDRYRTYIRHTSTVTKVFAFVFPPIIMSLLSIEQVQNSKVAFLVIYDTCSMLSQSGMICHNKLANHGWSVISVHGPFPDHHPLGRHLWTIYMHPPQTHILEPLRPRNRLGRGVEYL